MSNHLPRKSKANYLLWGSALCPASCDLPRRAASCSQDRKVMGDVEQVIPSPGGATSFR